MIIAVANSKGGVGKSTIAVHLAAWLHEQGHTVILADCDAQTSSKQWAAEAIPEVPVERFDSSDEVYERLPGLAHNAAYVVADGPGSNSETSRALLLCADLALIPCKASMLEVRALNEATKVLRHAQSIRAGKPQGVLVLSMVGDRYRLTQDMKTAAEALKLPLASAAMKPRQAYADAPGQGTLVWHMGSRGREAAQEVLSIFRELLPQACAAKVRSLRRRGRGA